MKLAALTWAFLALSTCWSGSALAGSDSSAFQVKARLTPNAGLCTTTSLATAYQAEVTVVCGTNQVVGIRLPAGFSGFSPRHGGAGNYLFGSATRFSGVLNDSEFGLGLGTITALHVVNNAGADSLEVWVSW
jgi:hypothetical protein